jgi:hypothetical protein
MKSHHYHRHHHQIYRCSFTQVFEQISLRGPFLSTPGRCKYDCVWHWRIQGGDLAVEASIWWFKFNRTMPGWIDFVSIFNRYMNMCFGMFWIKRLACCVSNFGPPIANGHELGTTLHYVYPCICITMQYHLWTNSQDLVQAILWTL